MTAATATEKAQSPDAAPHGDARSRPVGDTWVIAKRSLLHMRREPEALADATFQPVMFVLLFAYVFGGAIDVPGGGSYHEFLMGGIFAQTMAFGVFGVAMGLASDRKNGAVDRFRSLPIAKGSVLAGHAVANLLKGLLPILLMSISGLIVGWRTHEDPLSVAGAYALMILFTFAMIWIGVLLGSLLPTPEAVQGVAFVAIFPLTFVASTFVPTSTLPGILKTIAEWNPISALAGSLRQLFGNPGGDPYPGAPWSLHHPQLYVLIWVFVIIAVCAPLAIRVYNNSVSD